MRTEKDDVDELVCKRCETIENQELILQCASGKCATILHVYCVLPELYDIPEGDWYCGRCQQGLKGPGNGSAARGRDKGVDAVTDSSKESGHQSGGFREKGAKDDLQGQGALLSPTKSTLRAQEGVLEENLGRAKKRQRKRRKGTKPSSFPVDPPPLCRQPGCREKAYYGHPELFGALRLIVPRRCAKHRFHQMMRIGGPLCEVRACFRRANFAFEEERQRRCASHMESGMVRVTRSLVYMCRQKGCTSTASYRFDGEKARTACAKYAEPGMVSQYGTTFHV